MLSAWSPYFPLSGTPLLWGPQTYFHPGSNPLLAALLPHRAITAHNPSGIFSWSVDSTFILDNGKL
jgi:hypothetical protein